MKRQLLGLFAAFFVLSLASDARVVLNEINLVTGPNAGQFVELHGPPNQSVGLPHPKNCWPPEEAPQH